MILIVWGSNEPNIKEGNLEVEDLGADMSSCFLSDDEIKNPTPQTPTLAKLAAVAVRWRYWDYSWAKIKFCFNNCQQSCAAKVLWGRRGGKADKRENWLGVDERGCD